MEIYSWRTKGITEELPLPADANVVYLVQGREFYACAKPRESGCGHFQWADEVDNGGASGSGMN